LKKGELNIRVAADGQISTIQDVEIKCKASGEVISLPFDIGDKIKKGDLLLELDPVNEERNLDSARISLELAEIELENARLQYRIAKEKLAINRKNQQISLVSAKNRSDKAILNHERLSRLLEQSLSSQESVENAFSEKIDTQSNLQKIELQKKELDMEELSLTFREQDIKKAEATLALRKLQLSDAEQRLADTKVFSPTDGIISSRNIQTGQIIASGISNVTGGTTVMLISDISKLYVNAEIDESEIGNIKIGMPVQFTVEAFPFRSFSGEVERISVKGIMRSQIVFFSIRVRVKETETNLLKPGMSAALQINVDSQKDVLLIPYGAIIREDDGQSLAYAGETPDTAERKKITLGLCSDNCAVIEGLKKGETVLIPSETDDDPWRSPKSRKKRNKK
jgi:HlyD family secretion protein